MSDKEKIKEIISIIVNGSTKYTTYLGHVYFNINNRDFHKLLKLLDLKPPRSTMLPTRELDEALSRLISENSEVFSVYGISSPSKSPMYLDGFIRYEYEIDKYA